MRWARNDSFIETEDTTRWDNVKKPPKRVNAPVVIPAYGVTDVERAYWNSKQDALEYDRYPTLRSDKHCTSGVIHKALEDYKTNAIAISQEFFWAQVGGLAQTKDACEAAAEHAESVASGVEHYVEQAEAYKDAAQISATSAIDSANAAQSSANSAATSKVVAETAANTAAASAASVAADAASATASAEAAALSESNAAASATTAETNATNAANAATSAESSKDSAAASASLASDAATAAQSSATNAAASATSAASYVGVVTTKSEDAEAWAKGTRNGVDVPSTDPAYHNNAKYYAEQTNIIDDVHITTHTTFSSEHFLDDILTPTVNTIMQGVNSKADLVNGKIPSSELPSFVDDVIEGYYHKINDRFYEESTFETLITPVEGKSWVDVSYNKSYRWTGSRYVRVDEGVQLGETADTAYAGNKGKANADAISAIQNLIPSSASANNKLVTLTDIPASGMQASVYDPNGTVANAGGITAYVADAIDAAINTALAASY